MDVFDLVAKLTLDTSEYDKSLGDSEQNAMSFGKVFGGIAGGVAGAAAIGATAITAIGTATVGATKAVIDGASDVASYGDNIDKMSQKMGLSIESYQEWDAVMQHSGTSMESLKASMKTLANAAETGNEAFAQLGITEEEIANLNQEDLFSTTITALQNVEDTTQRTYLAGKLLGRGATELGALLNTSAEDTQAMKDRVHELGGVMSEEAVKASANFQDNLQDLTTAMDGVKRNILSDLLPGLSMLMDGFTRLLSGDMDADAILDEGIGKLLDGIENAGEKVINIASDILPRVIEGIANHFPELINGVVSLLTTMVPVLLDALANDVLPSLLSALPPILEMLFEVIPPFFFSVLDKVLEFIPQLMELAITLVLALADGISEALPELIPTAVSIVMQLIHVILRNLDKIVGAALDILMALVEGILTALPQLDTASYEIIFELIGAIIRMLPKIIETAITVISEFVGYLVETGIRLINGDIFGRLLDALVDVWKTINWGEIGSNIIKGIIEGITKGWDMMKDAVSGVVQKIKDIFTGGFEIHSPSKVFENYGRMIDEGLAIGIGSGLSVDATSKMANNVNDAFEIPSKNNTDEDKIINIYFGNDLFRSVVLDAMNTEVYISGGR